ncbi:MAG: hypothetical protein IKX97_04540 [Erysipelotrichaceae bacterium]|nr:hypothetical protein [Erysipelotrichaceae bacterium]
MKEIKDKEYDFEKFISVQKLRDSGFSYYKINKLVDNDVLKKINKSTYENLLYSGEENDFCNALAYVPDGVICLLTAARYYDLTNYMPSEIDIAIGRKDKVSTLPEWPAVRIHYFTKERLETGIIKENDQGLSFRIYDIEKTVADCIYYRNKVGIEEASEILRNYLKRSDRDIDRLYEYSKILHCEKVLRNYLEAIGI